MSLPLLALGFIVLLVAAYRLYGGWVARQFQIGLTGKFIAPEVYLGLGVSGRYNHMIGVQKSGLIIGINQDPSAEIFQTADIGVKGDCVAIAAEMIRQLEAEKE